jgi:hypothetical protein
MSEPQPIRNKPIIGKINIMPAGKAPILPRPVANSSGVVKILKRSQIESAPSSQSDANK